MKRGRMSDTAGLTASPSGIGTSVTKEVRKIDNGFIERTSSFNDKTGSYKSSEVFKPTANSPGPSSGAVGNESLSDVKSYLGGDV